MSTAPPQLASDLRLALGRVSRRLRRLYVEADPGPSFLELAVLHRLERTGTSSPSALAGDEGVTSAAVANCLGSLEGRGLVSRSRAPEDGRRVVVVITSQGRKTLRKRDDASIDRISRVVAAMSPAERAQLAAAVPLLERLATEL
jgi:DNA-binding MarR family transcriptional regulator